METLDVGAAVITHNGKILLTQRDKKRHMGGKWEFPGGKIENGESIEEGLMREIFEELGIEIELGNFVCTVVHQYPEKKIKLHAYICKPKKTDLKPTEHEELAWVIVNDLLNYDLVPADVKIVYSLLKRARI